MTIFHQDEHEREWTFERTTDHMHITCTYKQGAGRHEMHLGHISVPVSVWDLQFAADSQSDKEKRLKAMMDEATAETKMLGGRLSERDPREQSIPRDDDTVDQLRRIGKEIHERTSTAGQRDATIEHILDVYEELVSTMVSQHYRMTNIELRAQTLWRHRRNL